MPRDEDRLEKTIIIITNGIKELAVVTPMTYRRGGKHYRDGQCEIYPGST